MRRYPADSNEPAMTLRDMTGHHGELGVVLSGGGTRAAYQVGALRALLPTLDQSDQKISLIIGSSIGAINGLMLAAGLNKGLSTSLDQLEAVWRERTYRNTFVGNPSLAFFRAVRMAAVQYLQPGPNPSNESIFDPKPLMDRVDGVLEASGGLSPANLTAPLHTVAVMTTVEGPQRKPLVFLSSNRPLHTDLMRGASFDVSHVKKLSAKHGFASAALPSVLPPVELDTDEGTVRLVDGGISINIPIDPAMRLGAERIIAVDISGRQWWHDRHGEAHDTRPTWEVEAKSETFCLRPPEIFVARNQSGLGPILKHAVSRSTKKFIAAVGPIWPVFTLLKNKLGEEVAYEVMSYVALDKEYVQGLIETGYNETRKLLQLRSGQ